MSLKPLKQNDGFTLVELLVMAPVVMVTIVLMMSFLFNQYGQLTQQGAQINLQTEAQNITFSMQDDVFFAQAFTSTTNANLVDNYAPGGGWQADTTPQTLIISSPALTNNRRSPDRQPVYINELGCGEAQLKDNPELYNNIIYFVSGDNLYKRILTAPSSMDTCGVSYMKQSCPEAQATTDCPPDRLLTDKLQSFTITYLDSDNVALDTPDLAERIRVDLVLKDRAYAEDITSDSTITLRKLNQ